MARVTGQPWSRMLRLLKCDEMQGYLFSKPLPAAVFEAQFLAARAPEPR
jgi:EAL domain-containing protein (putative c-di-GMP-specific phosphodiesterase class I)